MSLIVMLLCVYMYYTNVYSIFRCLASNDVLCNVLIWANKKVSYLILSYLKREKERREEGGGGWPSCFRTQHICCLELSQRVSRLWSSSVDFCSYCSQWFAYMYTSPFMAYGEEKGSFGWPFLLGTWAPVICLFLFLSGRVIVMCYLIQAVNRLVSSADVEIILFLMWEPD